MELRTLRYFLAVAREQNITRAAESLHLTQPTLSRQLMSLEEELGVPLFERSHKNLIVSEAGLVLKRRAEEILQLTDLAQKEVISSEETIAGDIFIGCGITLATETMGKLVSRFQQLYPDVVFHIYNGNTENIMEKIDHGLLDIGFVLDPERIDQYDFIRLKDPEKWGLLMRLDNPLSYKEDIEMTDLEKMSLIGTPRINIQNDFNKWLGSSVSHLQFSATSELSATGATLVKNGIGAAIMVEGAATDLNPQIYCFRPLKPAFYAYSYIVWKKMKKGNNALSRFLKFIQEKAV